MIYSLNFNTYVINIYILFKQAPKLEQLFKISYSNGLSP